LRQLESTGTKTIACKLLREEIENKSVVVKNLCDELKDLKR
jgi:hypothetical protein